MEVKDLENILNAMPETGVYVVREDDHRLLYFNRRAKEASPEMERGRPCHEIGGRACRNCPLLTAGERTENRSVSYSGRYGGVVEITASRILWEDGVPAWVMTVLPRMETAGYTYRKILKVDLEKDRCDVLKSDPGSWHPEEGCFSEQMERFANSGSIHPDDIDRIVAFTRMETLGAVSGDGQNNLSITYRRRDGQGYRWNLMEVVPAPVCGDGGRSAILCVKDVHNVMREGLERADVSMRNQELIHSLGERNFDIYTVDLRSGAAVPIRLDNRICEGAEQEPRQWEELMRSRICDSLHENYREEFARQFSLEGLRQARGEGRQKIELLCQQRAGGQYRYISVSASFGRWNKGRGYTVLALEDVDDRMRRELAHSKRDMQMAAILESRFTVIDTVNLEDGTFQQIDLTRPAGSGDTEVSDYSRSVQDAVTRTVHPDDIETFWATVALDSLRKKAETVEDYREEICEYRRRTDPPTWRELHVMYRRQPGGPVQVNILERDITRQKQREVSQRQVLEDRSYIISSMSSLFFTTYYIDLENDTFRAVNQLRRVGDVLGDAVNCTAALQIYANHFVHPDDREDYLSVMNVENLRQSLRWWQPYVAVEYRRLPEGGNTDACDWVRATAVLARAGAEETPRTAVYVAQDISDRRVQG